jgi:hypothetical protein
MLTDLSRRHPSTAPPLRLFEDPERRQLRPKAPKAGPALQERHRVPPAVVDPLVVLLRGGVLEARALAAGEGESPRDLEELPGVASTAGRAPGVEANGEADGHRFQRDNLFRLVVVAGAVQNQPPGAVGLSGPQVELGPASRAPAPGVTPPDLPAGPGLAQSLLQLGGEEVEAEGPLDQRCPVVISPACRAPAAHRCPLRCKFPISIVRNFPNMWPHIRRFFAIGWIRGAAADEAPPSNSLSRPVPRRLRRAFRPLGGVIPRRATPKVRSQ